MIQFLTHSPKTAFDIPKAFSVGKLSECHTQELIIAFKRASAMIAVITIYALPKIVFRHKLQNLGENRTPLVHWPLLPLVDFNLEGITAVLNRFQIDYDHFR
jgi:hypothetical protein